MDKIVSFSIKDTDFVGKFVKLQDSLEDIDKSGKIPQIVKKFLSDLRVIITLLGSGLKHNGSLTITIQSEKYIKFATADYFDNGTIRSYVKLRNTDKFTNEISFNELIGDGKLLLTMNYQDMKNYQSVIDINGHNNLSEVMSEYFLTSEQLPSYIKIFHMIKYNSSINNLSAGGIILQNLSNNHGNQLINEKWREIGLLIETLQENELADKTKPIESILYKLFHEYGVIKYEEKIIKFGCKCSKEKFVETIKSFETQEIASMYQNEQILINCNFCDREIILTQDDF